MDSCGSGWGPSEGSCEHNNGSIRGREFLDLVSIASQEGLCSITLVS